MVISKERLEASRKARQSVINKYAEDTAKKVEKILKEEGPKRAEAAKEIIERKGKQAKRNAKMYMAKENARRIKKNKAQRAAEKAAKILANKAAKASGKAAKILEEKAEEARRKAEEIRQRRNKKEKPKFFDTVRPMPVPTIPDEPRDNTNNVTLEDELEDHDAVTSWEEDRARIFIDNMIEDMDDVDPKLHQAVTDLVVGEADYETIQRFIENFSDDLLDYYLNRFSKSAKAKEALLRNMYYELSGKEWRG